MNRCFLPLGILIVLLRRRHSRGRQKSNRDDDHGNKETWGDVLPIHLRCIFFTHNKEFPNILLFYHPTFLLSS